MIFRQYSLTPFVVDSNIKLASSFISLFLLLRVPLTQLKMFLNINSLSELLKGEKQSNILTRKNNRMNLLIILTLSLLFFFIFSINHIKLIFGLNQQSYQRNTKNIFEKFLINKVKIDTLTPKLQNNKYHIISEF